MFWCKGLAPFVRRRCDGWHGLMPCHDALLDAPARARSRSGEGFGAGLERSRAIKYIAGASALAENAAWASAGQRRRSNRSGCSRHDYA